MSEVNAVEFKEWLKSTTFYSPTTINNYFFAIRKLLMTLPFENWTVEKLNEQILTHNKEFYNATTFRGAIINFLKWQNKEEWRVKLIKVKNRGTKKLPSNVSYEDIKKLFGQFEDATCQDVFTIQALSGCRQVEAWLIESKNVQFQRDCAKILVRQKGGRNEQIVISNLHLAKRVFHNKRYKGRKYVFLPESLQDLSIEDILVRHYVSIRQRYRRAWIQACEKAGLPQYRSHDARRAVGRAVYEQAGIYASQKVLRHRNIETTAKYIEGMRIDIADVLGKAIK